LRRYTGSAALVVLLLVGLMVGRRIVAYRSGKEAGPAYQALDNPFSGIDPK